MSQLLSQKNLVSVYISRLFTDVTKQADAGGQTQVYPTYFVGDLFMGKKDDCTVGACFTEGM